MTQRQLFLQHLAQTSDFPLMIEVERAEGIYIYSPDGKRYADLISGIGVSSVGHCHPKVVKAVQTQVAKYMHVMVYGEYVQTPQVEFARLLCSHLPETLNQVYLVNSGAEAIEGAMKLAKRYTQRQEIISCYLSYHGNTHGALSINGSEDFKQGYYPMLPQIKHIRFGNFDDLALITEKTAAIFIETVQGEAGVRTASSAYFQALRKKCNKTGTLLVLDEIQCGFGRTGKLWAFQHFGIIPDILVIAKAMGGGMPIGGFVASQNVMQVLKNNPILGHITTFGGHPVSAAAAKANLEVILEEDLIATIHQKAALFKKYLKHPSIKSVRNLGLMMAAEMESFEVLKPTIDRAIELGVITDWFLYCNNAMRIAPPLIITPEQIQECCEIIIKAIKV